MPDPAQLHADQVRYWNGAGGARWLSQRERREKTRTSFSNVVMTRAAAKPGEFVIDVGCGLGDTSIALAEAVGPNGRLLAVDVSEPLLTGARERLEPYPWAEAVLADASAFAFPTAAADLLFSRFGVMFFGDPVAAFANIRTALKPAGRMVFACWEKNQTFLAVEAAYKVLPDLPPHDPLAPGPMSLAKPERIEAVLTGAGFKTPSLELIEVMIDVAAGEGLDVAVTSTLQAGPAGRLLEGQTEAAREKVAVAVREAMAPYADGGTVKLPASFWIVSATIAPN